MTGDEIREQFAVLREQLCTQKEAAAAFGVTPVCVSLWVSRYPDFPAAMMVTGKVKLYVQSELIAWYVNRERTKHDAPNLSDEALVRANAMASRLQTARMKTDEQS